MGTRIGLWRWRRNPLRRRSDVTEAWVVLGTFLLLATGAPAVGAAVGLNAHNTALRHGRDWQRTTAVLVSDAPDSVYADTRAAVRWTAPDGSTRIGTALVRAGTGAGAAATVWQDERGAMREAPVTATEAAAQGVLFGTLAAGGTAAVVLGSRWVVRVRLDRGRDREWERAWAAMGPRPGHRPA
ncbi:Rv1733c family protein [Streptomyces sp. NPDC005141]